MKIAIVGYGKMGKAIEKIANERGHEIVVKIDKDNQTDFNSLAFEEADVAIEFSSPKSALNNFNKCFEKSIPLVSGTTGWLSELHNVISKVEQNQLAFLYASNFSVGVNLMFWLNKQLAQLMDRFAIYDVSMREIHHTEKKDAPSGTAITLAEDIIHKMRRIDSWKLGDDGQENELPIEAIRKTDIFGYHEVNYESDQDTIQIIHNAKSREGFALGAVIAAEFLQGKRGFFTMDDVLKF